MINVELSNELDEETGDGKYRMLTVSIKLTPECAVDIQSEVLATTESDAKFSIVSWLSKEFNVSVADYFKRVDLSNDK